MPRELPPTTLTRTWGHAAETIQIPATPISERTAELPIAHVIRAVRDDRTARRRLLQRIATVYITLGCSLLVGVFGIGVLEAAGVNVIEVPAPDGQHTEFNAIAILQPASVVPSSVASPDDTGTPVGGLDAVVAARLAAPDGSTAIPSEPWAEPTTPRVESRVSSATPVVRVLMPSIEVSAPVVVHGVDPDGVMQTPRDPAVVAWYDFSAHPLDPGNAVLAGHLDDNAIGPAVFWRLDDLRAGDEITVVLADGTTVSYRVTSKALVGGETDDTTFQRIVGPTAIPSITFITCTGRFNPAARYYDQRLVVRAERTSVAPAP